MRVLTHVDRDAIRRLLAQGEFFWLDLVSPSHEDLQAAGDHLGLHPAAVEDGIEWDQIARFDDYPDHVSVVLFTARVEGDGAVPVEVHLHVTGGYALTVRRDRTPLDSLHAWVREMPAEAEDDILYHLLDALADGWDPVIEHLDRKVDEVEAEVLTRPRREHLPQIYHLRQEIRELDRRASAQRELLPDVVAAIHALSGLAGGSRDWMRDVTTHAQAVAGDLDRLMGDLAGLTDTFFNANQNRLSRLATMIAIGSVFFLVWTLVTSFFGQNFRWLVDSVESSADFLAFGVGGLVVPTVILAAVFWFRRDEWW